MKKIILTGCRLSLDICRFFEENEMTEALYPTIFGLFVNRNGSCQRPEGIDTNILIICEGGKGFIHGSNIDREITPGDILLIPSDTPHSYGTKPNETWNISWCHFSGSQSANFLGFSEKEIKVIHPPEPVFANTIRIYRDFYELISGDLMLNTMIGSSQALRHLLSYIQIHSTITDPHSHLKDSIEKAVDLMNESVEGHLSLDQLAVAAGLSVSRFSTVFKNKTGLSPIDYFNNLKMRHACHYLDSTGLSIKEVSEAIGIDNQYYFSRLFKKTVGIPPREYRKLKLQL